MYFLSDKSQIRGKKAKAVRDDLSILFSFCFHIYADFEGLYVKN